MAIKYAVKYAFADKYLAVAVESDKTCVKNRTYAYHDCNAIYEIALFDTKEEAIKAYENAFVSKLNETGIIVEMIID